MISANQLMRRGTGNVAGQADSSGGRAEACPLVVVKRKIGERMYKNTRHTFRIGASPDAIADALMQEKHLQRWVAKEAHVQESKGILGWSGYGFEVEFDMAYDRATRAVVWQCTGPICRTPTRGKAPRSCLYSHRRELKRKLISYKQAIENRRVMKIAIRDGRSSWARVSNNTSKREKDFPVPK